MPNVYFDLTREFNRGERVAVLCSGQAVVFYRIAIMSKDGDWIVRETEAACATVLDVLDRHGARYRPSAPLDPRWLAGGWSSHFEFFDERRRRVRCDFFSRPPRLSLRAVEALFATSLSDDPLAVVDPESLVRMKQTQRAKDYAVIGEVARLLPPEKELELTTDPDRILALGTRLSASRRAARARGRDAVVVELAREIDEMQRMDRERLARYEESGRDYAALFRKGGLAALPLREAHARAQALAEDVLPRFPMEGRRDAPE